VFAFALTLMVVTLDVPQPHEVTDAALPRTVRGQWPEFLSYGISFLVIGIFWFAHRRLFRQIVADDTISGWLNVLFLFCIAFLPYPTDMQGNFPDSRFALNFYNVWTVITSLALFVLWEYVRRYPRLTGGQVPPSPLGHEVLRESLIAGPFLLSILVSFVSVDAARYCWFLLLPGHLYRRREEKRRDRPSSP
jgi:uncharacterized membrane protein